MADLRLRVRNKNRIDATLVYPFAMFLEAVEFVTSSLTRTLDRLIMAFDMQFCANDVLQARTGASRLVCQSEIFSGLNITVLDQLDVGTRTALDRLATVSHKIPVLITEIGDATRPFAGDSHICQVAIAHLKCSFAENAKDLIKNHCSFLPSVVDLTYSIEIKQ